MDWSDRSTAVLFGEVDLFVIAGLLLGTVGFEVHSRILLRRRTYLVTRSGGLVDAAGVPSLFELVPRAQAADFHRPWNSRATS